MSSSPPSFSNGSWPGLAPSSEHFAVAVKSASEDVVDKPHIEYPDWNLILNDDDSGEYDSATHVLNLTLDEATKIVDTTLKTRSKLGDDNKWAEALCESLTSKFHKIVKGEIIYCGGRSTYKGTMTSVVVNYLIAMRKFVFEAA